MIVGVLVELSNKNIDRVFEYSVPEDLTSLMKVGIRVLVPFGKMELEGFVLDIKNHKDTDKDLKSVISVVDSNVVLNDELLELGKVIQKKTLSTLISCYQVMLPKALKAKNGSNISIRFDTYYSLNDNVNFDKLNDTQEKIINLVKEKGIVLKKELADISVSSLNTLIRKGYLIESKKEQYRVLYKEIEFVKKKLTDDQERVVNSVINGSDNT